MKRTTCPLCGASATVTGGTIDGHFRGDRPGLTILRPACPAADGTVRRARVLAEHERECPTGDAATCPRCSGQST